MDRTAARHPVAPPANFFGPLYPTDDHGKMAEIFGIAPGDRVLDIGGGDNPFGRADVIVDVEFDSSTHRDGRAIREDLRHKFVKADVCGRLPFDDKSFDFVFCSHVLEHVADPAAACAEIMRVGRRGYIETPRKWMEFFAGHPSHQWLVDLAGGELVFEKRRFIDSPYMNCALLASWGCEDLQARGLRDFRNISCVQMPWEGSFRVSVIGKSDAAYEYTDPLHAALAHYHTARNALLLGAPPGMALVHAERPAELRPDVDLFWVLLAVYALLLDRKDLWQRASEILLQRGIVGRAEVVMSRFGLRRSLTGRLLQLLKQKGQDPA